MRLALWGALSLLGCTSSPAPAPVEPPATVEVTASVSPAPSSVAPVPTTNEGGEVVRREARARLAECGGGAKMLSALSSLAPPAREALVRENGPWSLQAAWENDRLPLGGHLEPAGVAHFFKRVVDTLGTPPPSWWIDALRGATVHDNGVTSYSVVAPLIALYKTEVPFGPGKVRVRQGTLVSDLKPEMLDARPGGVDHIELLRDSTSKTVFVVGFSAGSGGFPFPVHRFDGPRLVWKATACTAGRQVLGGLGALVLEMARVQDKLVVWSAESHGVAIDVFDADKGDATMRFSSDLWMARQGP